MPQLTLGLPPTDGFLARDFVVSAANREAWSALATWPPHEGAAAVLVGVAGSGKSHLAAIWAERTAADRLAPDILIETVGDATRHLLVEDVDRGFDDTSLFHLINLGRRPGCSLLLTARSHPGAWPATLPDLRSRLNALAVWRLEPPDDAVLGGMLQRFFRARSIRPNQELLDFLVRRIERSAAGAQAVVDRLDRESLAQGRAVNRSLAAAILAGPAPDGDAEPEADGEERD